MRTPIPPRTQLKRELAGNQLLFWTDLWYIAIILVFCLLISLSTLNVIIKVLFVGIIIVFTFISFLRINEERVSKILIRLVKLLFTKRVIIKINADIQDMDCKENEESGVDEEEDEEDEEDESEGKGEGEQTIAEEKSAKEKKKEKQEEKRQEKEKRAKEKKEIQEERKREKAKSFNCVSWGAEKAINILKAEDEIQDLPQDIVKQIEQNENGGKDKKVKKLFRVPKQIQLTQEAEQSFEEDEEEDEEEKVKAEKVTVIRKNGITLYPKKDIRWYSVIEKIEDNQYKYTTGESAYAIKIQKTSFNFLFDWQQESIILQLNEFYKVMKNYTIISMPKKIRLEPNIQYAEKLSTKCFSEYTDDKSLFNLARLNIAINLEEGLKKNDINAKELKNVPAELEFFIILYNTSKEEVKTIQEILYDANILTDICTDKELAILYKYCFNDNFYENEYDELDTTKPQEVIDWCLPNKIQFEVNAIKYNDTEFKVFYINKYPTVVDTAWMYDLVAFPFVKTFFHSITVENTIAKKRLEKASSIKEVRLEKALKKSETIELEDEAYQLNEVLVDLTRGEKIQNIIPIFVVENNKEKIGMFTQMITTKGFGVANLLVESENFLSNCIPYMTANFIKYGRLMPTKTIANGFPFIGTKIQDKEGIYIGKDFDDIPVCFDNMIHRKERGIDDKDRINGNIVVFGTTGAGKSHLLKLMLKGWIAELGKTLIFDIEDEYRNFANLVKAKMLDIGGGDGEDSINPLHIFPTVDPEEKSEQRNNIYRSDVKKLYQIVNEEPKQEYNYKFASTVGNPINAQISFLKSFHKLAMPEITTEENSILCDIIADLYEAKGIKNSTNFREAKATDFPTYADVLPILEKKYKEKDKANKEYESKTYRILISYIKQFCNNGAYAHIWGKPTNINLEDNIIVLSFRSLLSNGNNDIVNAQLFLLMRYVELELIKNKEWSEKIGEIRPYRIIIDEVQKLINEQLPIGYEKIADLAVRVRKYNGAIILLTQNIKNFNGTTANMQRCARNIIGAMQYKFCLKLNQDDINDLFALFQDSNNLTDVDTKTMLGFHVGECLGMVSNTKRIKMKVENWEDEEMFTR